MGSGWWKEVVPSHLDRSPWGSNGVVESVPSTLEDSPRPLSAKPCLSGKVKNWMQRIKNCMAPNICCGVDGAVTNKWDLRTSLGVDALRTLPE